MTFSTYTVFPSREDYITPGSLYTPDGEQISDQINLLFVELNKLGKILNKSVDEMTSMDMWSVFLGKADDPKHRELINEIIARKEVMGMAGAVLAGISKDEHERAKFMSRHKAEFERTSNLLAVEARLRNEVAREMKAEGISLESIARITKLSIEDIQEL